MMDEKDFSKVQLVHPFDIAGEVKSHKEINSIPLINIDLRLIEIEASIKQIYYILTIADKVKQELQPIQAILKHIRSQEKKHPQEEKAPRV